MHDIILCELGTASKVNGRPDMITSLKPLRGLQTSAFSTESRQIHRDKPSKVFFYIYTKL